MIPRPDEIPGLVLLEVDAELASQILAGRASSPSPGPTDDGTRAALGTRVSQDSVRVVAIVRVEHSYAPHEVAIAGGGDGWAVAVPPEEDPGHQGLWVFSDLAPVRPTVVAAARHRGVTYLSQADADLIEGLACGVTARTIWEYLRMGQSLDGVYARVPAWARCWVHDVEMDIASSVADVVVAVHLAAEAGEPGPYRDHVRDLTSGNDERMMQRIWATYRPGPELPARML